MPSRLTKFCATAVFVAIEALSLHAAADTVLCCTRVATFLPMSFPTELKSNPMIDGSIYGTLREGTTSCDGVPIQYEELDWEGRQQLQKYDDAISASEGIPLDIEAQTIFELQLDLDYVWSARLSLNKIDEIVPGDKQGGEPPKVRGDWTLNLALMNVQFNETAKEAEVSWNGLAGGGVFL